AISTPLADGHPMLVLQSHQREELSTRMRFEPGQRYSKWSVVFEDKVRIDEVEVIACPDTKGFEDGVELFVNFDEKRHFADGGRGKVKFQPRSDARVLTLSFLETEGLCVQSIALRTGGKSTSLFVPEVIRANGDWRLGNGRIGTFSPPLKVKGKKSDAWELSWERDLIVDGLRIWNGNQHLGEGFLDSARVQELVIKANAGIKMLPSETVRVSLDDRRGFQKIEFKNPLPLRSLELTSLEKFDGGIHQEPVLGEVQLLAGGLAWIPWVAGDLKLTDGQEPNLQAIRAAGFQDILDRELRIDGKTEVWKFRFRSDGTVAAQVFTDRARTARKWTFLGSWSPATVPQEAASKPKQGGMFARVQAKSTPAQSFGLRVVGVRFSSADFADSVPCGNQCFSSTDGRGPSTIRELPVNEILEIQRESKTFFYLRNRTAAEERTLDFSDLKLRVHSLYN
ncbi:MAG: hypothetical protein U1E10_12765, partial [Bdellovibrionales bacterium]|nr:hypothetical protein [Bdellovibrionales bacterium]